MKKIIVLFMLLALLAGGVSCSHNQPLRAPEPSDGGGP